MAGTMAPPVSRETLPPPQYGTVKKLSSDEAKAFVGDYHLKITSAITTYKPRMDKIRLADKYWLGEHWDDVAEPWMPKPVENWVFATVEQHSANLATANIVPIIIGQDPGDDEISEIFDFVLQHLWQPNKLNMRRVIRRSIHAALLTGTAVAKVYFDSTKNGGRQFLDSVGTPMTKEFQNPLNGEMFPVSHTLYKGEVCVELVDVTNVIPDPTGYALSGPGACSWIAIRTIRNWDWIENYPMFVEYVGKNQLKTMRERLNGKPNKTNTEIYHNRPSNLTHNGTTEAELDEVWIRRMDEYGNWHIDLLYKIQDEPLYYAQDIYEDGEYPLALLYDYEVEKSFHGIGEPDQVIPNQNTINQINRLAALNAMHMTNTQKVVTYDSGVDPDEVAKFGTMPGAVWRSRTADGITPIKVQEIPATVFKVAETAREGIRTIMAMDEANMGQFGGSVTAASGLKLIQDKANIRDQDKGMNVEDFVSRITTLMISRVQQFYATERYIPIVDPLYRPGMEQKFFPFLGTAHKDVNLVVNIMAGSGAPVNKQQISQQAWDMFIKQAESKFEPPLITAVELLDCLNGFPMKERIKKRIKEAETGAKIQEIMMMAQAMMQLQAQGIDPSTVPPEQLMALLQQMMAPPQPTEGPPPGPQQVA